MVLDLFDLGDLESIVRKAIREKGVIDLHDYDIPTYQIPEDYIIETKHFISCF